MNPDKKQQQQLFTDYIEELYKAAQEPKPEKESLRKRYATAFKEAIQFLEKNVDTEVFNLAAMGSEVEATRLAQQKYITLFHRFLDQTIDTSHEPVRFNKEFAFGIKAYLLDPELKIKDRVLVYEAPNQLGIREKYTRGILNGKHWVTDLDLKRMLEAMGLDQKVSIVPLSIQSIAATLDLAKKDIEAKRTEKTIEVTTETGTHYIIPLIINCGDSHWISARVFYSPTSGEVSYQIEDSVGLSQETRKKYQETIEAAIDSQDSFHPAFKERTLVTEEGHHVPASSITGNHSQTDSYSCGYRALHALLQNADVRGNNLQASSYASLDKTNSETLVKHFFQIQLESFNIPVDIYNIFAKHQQFKKPLVKDAELVTVDDIELQRFIEKLEAAPVQQTIISEAVTKGIGSYSAGQELLSFPIGAKSDDLDAIQYEHFFTELSNDVFKTASIVPVLRLSHADSEALKGLNSFVAVSDSAIPFRTLQINVDIGEKETEGFVRHLELALKNLSRQNLVRLTIDDPQGRLQEKDYKQLKDFVVKEKIAIKIDLPEQFKAHNLQRQFDAATAINLREKNSETLVTSLSKEKLVAKEKKDRPVRARPDVDFTKAINTDVELQKGVEESVIVDPFVTKTEKSKQYTEINRVTHDDLRLALASEDPAAFNIFAKVARGLTKKEFVDYWHTLSANIANSKVGTKFGEQLFHVNPQFAGFTDTALEQLIQFKKYFQKGNGINIDQLPQGFVLISDPKNPQATLLHYDPASTIKGSFAPALVEPKKEAVLSIDVVESALAKLASEHPLKALWQSLQKEEQYSQKDSEIFRKFLPQLMTLEVEKINELVELCVDVENFDYDKLQFIFEHLEQARNSYSDNYDEDHENSLISIDWMLDENRFLSVAGRRSFVTLAKTIADNKGKQASETHPLFTVLEQEEQSSLRARLWMSVEELHLSNDSLNEILRLYDKYGTGGIEKLLKKWDDIVATPGMSDALFLSIAQNSTNYESLLLNDRILDAAKTIGAFGKEQRQWWDKLYEAHVPKEDDFLSVYNSFTAFSSAIAQHGLTFYSIDFKKYFQDNKKSGVLFKGIGNLPATVGRILSILSLCDTSRKWDNKSDRAAQWEVMSEIDLSSEGALRALNFAKGQPRACGFVIPQMDIDPDKELTLNLYDGNYKWDSSTEVTNSKEINKFFYGYLAYQEHRFALDFYKEAKKKVDDAFPGEHFNSTRTKLYSLLLASTTGDNYKFYAQTPEMAMEQWKNIINEIKDVKASLSQVVRQVQEQAVDELYKLGKIPALPVLSRLTTLSMAPFHDISLAGETVGQVKKLFGGKESQLEEEAKKLLECNKRLKSLLYSFGDNIYLGMKFYDDNDYKPVDNKSLFVRHLEVSEKIAETNFAFSGTLDSHSREFQFLMQEHVSTFHITPDDVKQLASAVKFAINNKFSPDTYPEGHEKAGLKVPQLSRQGRSGLLFATDRQGAQISSISYLYPGNYPEEKKRGTEIPGFLKAELREMFVYPESHINKGQIIPVDEVSTIDDAVKVRGYVYPQGHELAGQVVSGSELVKVKQLPPDVSNIEAELREIYVYPETDEKKGERIPENVDVSSIPDAEKMWGYVYPAGHELAGQLLPDIELVKERKDLRAAPIVAELRKMYFYPETHENKGVRIPDGVDVSTIPGAVRAWVHVYPKGHELAGQILSENRLIIEEEPLPEPPVVGALKEVYFYPANYSEVSKRNQPIPSGEELPVGAVLKVAYFYIDSDKKAEQIIEGGAFDVKEVKVNYRYPAEHKNSDKNVDPVIAEFRRSVYPEGHPRAGHFCPFVFSDENRGEENNNDYANVLVNYGINLLRDINNIGKAGTKERLKAKDLQQFIFTLGDKVYELIPAIKNEVALHEGAFNDERQRLNSEIRARKTSLQEELKAKAETIDEEYMTQYSEKMLKLEAEAEEVSERYSHRKLIENIFEANPDYKNALLDFVESRMKAHFPVDYFKNKRATKATPQVELEINTRFKEDKEARELVQKIQTSYSKEDAEKQVKLIMQLHAAGGDLTPVARLDLFKLLQQPKLTEASLDEYLALLDAINNRGSSSFIYFLQVADRFPHQPIANLTEKATYFLTKALPQIREIKTNDIGEVELANLAVDVVLAANPNELQQEFDIKPLLVDALTRLKSALEGTDLSKIEEAINNLAIYRPDLKEILDLRQHLEWLQKKETEPYVITPEQRIIKEKPAKTIISSVATELAKAAGKTVFNGAKRFGKWLWGSSKETVTPRENIPPKQESPTTEAKETGTRTDGEDDQDVTIIPAQMGVKDIVKEPNRELFKNVSNVLDTLISSSKSYTFALAETFGLIKELINSNPSAKSQILAQCRHYLSFNTTDGSQIIAAFNNIHLLKTEFEALNDQNLVISLCEHFGAVAKKPELGALKDKNRVKTDYRDLFAILSGQTIKKGEHEYSFTAFPKLDENNPGAKKQILTVVTALLNNNKPCSLRDIEGLISRCADEKTGVLYKQTIEKVFANAPYPSFEQVNSWFDDAVNNIPAENLVSNIVFEYNRWSREPVQREEGVNGFDLKKAREQVKKLKGIHYTENDLKQLDAEVNGDAGVKHLDTAQLIEEIKQIRSDADLQKANRKDPSRLVALTAELLYRTKGLEAVGEGKTRKWGRSFEINTTQYLAIHSMLKAGGHVTSQIGTGEGKSRIMMISLACQYALGNTVDFVTADVSLATRDYLEFQAFFKSFGAETRLIKSDMPPEEYILDGGIHFSDPTNLSLFRNKARSEGKLSLVIEADPKKRALMLDEADKTYFDCANTRFNYSAQANPETRGMEWIYPLLVDFFSQEGNEALFKKDADRCNEAFINFARGKLIDHPEWMARLEFNKDMPRPVVSKNQLEAWQFAALQALHLELGNQFTIIKDVTVQTKHGTQFVNQAQLRSDGRASGAAKFSFGVHQCLHARLNMVRSGLLPRDPLKEKVNQKVYPTPFYIDPETQIVYSSTSKSLLDEYEEGEMLAVTGTAGSVQEKEEARQAYAQKVRNKHGELVETKSMTFLDVPRHRGQQRIDFPVALTNNKTAQQQKILKSIIAAIENDQPILLVCEDDNESAALYKFLEENLTDTQKQKLKRISAETPLEEELAHVKDGAGQPGAITVSTAMLGRGTDIELHGEAIKKGLKVIGTYLPRVRDFWQIIGRAGRFGAEGDSQLILDIEREGERIQKFLGLKSIPLELYTATHDYLELLQARMDVFEQKQRLIKDVVNDFRLELTKEFFDEFKASLAAGYNTDEVLVPWQQFVDKGDKLWNQLLPKIQAQLEKEPINIEQINGDLQNYQVALQSEWTNMKADLQARFEAGKVNKAQPQDKVKVGKLRVELSRLSLPENVIALLTRQVQKTVLQTPIAKTYDPAYVGRAVIYESKWDSFKAFFKNFAAAWRGEGIWFPNFKAWRNGNMSTSQFFFGSWGSPLVSPKAPEAAETSAKTSNAIPRTVVVTEHNEERPSVTEVPFGSSYSKIMEVDGLKPRNDVPGSVSSSANVNDEEDTLDHPSTKEADEETRPQSEGTLQEEINVTNTSTM
ncbi:preprotein translocase subunit SecA [Legionella hackeliae]|uniref:Uncharacterized protein n=1 Tax=Legionella hackeliae TaxID=449 RepID=A0A0A8URK1_LEGHA|nr:hypothetical protein [Legionella hackeliae]KTD10212.1 coiled-coil protein [Legionella hackeliae]CEK09707.1 protein of unknown function [Legionella hackeliae]STX49617.1 coiled-coil protein [Legionella hackeliae]